jgi:hypothetical protein
MSKESGNPAKLRITHDGPATIATTATVATTATTSSVSTTAATVATTATTSSTTGVIGTTTGSAPAAIEFAPVADSYVRGGTNSNDNYGGVNPLAVKRAPGSDDWTR